MATSLMRVVTNNSVSSTPPSDLTAPPVDTPSKPQSIPPLHLLSAMQRVSAVSKFHDALVRVRATFWL